MKNKELLDLLMATGEIRQREVLCSSYNDDLFRFDEYYKKYKSKFTGEYRESIINLLDFIGYFTGCDYGIEIKNCVDSIVDFIFETFRDEYAYRHIFYKYTREMIGYMDDELENLYKLEYDEQFGYNIKINGERLKIARYYRNGNPTVDLTNVHGKTVYGQVLGIEKDLKTGEVSIIKNCYDDKENLETVKIDTGKFKIVF